MQNDMLTPDKDLSAEEKKKRLFDRQLQLLDTFLEHNAISADQYEKSKKDLAEKMGYSI